jgi:restriction endonuclease Mrr
MTIPDYQTIMLRFLQFAKDGKTLPKREATDYLAEIFKLSDDGKAILLQCLI